MIYVIIPVYNTEPYLEECLSSVFAQTVEKRIICVNDGSTDGSLTILKKFQRAHSELTVLSINNSGPSHARNVALDYVFDVFGVAEKDLIAFVDSDDFVAETYLQTLFDALERDHSDISCCNFCFYNDGRLYPFTQKPEAGVYSGFEATRELLSDRTLQSHTHCKLYRAELWNAVRFPEDIIAMEDQGTVFKVFCKSAHVSVIDYNGYSYRQRSDSVCAQRITNKRVLDSLKGYLMPCIYSFPEFNHREALSLQRVAVSSFALVYLMMLPRFDYKLSDQKEREALKRFIKKEHELSAVRALRPRAWKERLKKWCYLLCRPIYCALFRLVRLN